MALNFLIMAIGSIFLLGFLYLTRSLLVKFLDWVDEWE